MQRDEAHRRGKTFFRAVESKQQRSEPENHSLIHRDGRGLWEESILAIKLQWRPLCFFLGCSLIAAGLLSRPASAQENGQQGKEQTQSSGPQQAAQHAPPSNPDLPDKVNPARVKQGQQSTQNQNNGGQNHGHPTSPKNDRLFGVLPNYLTVENEAKAPSLTSGGKYKLAAEGSFDPVIYPFIGFLALISQGQNSEPGYGQGAAGYGRRYAAAFADSTIGNFMTGAIFPSLLKQDPRYFQLVRGGFKRRAIYSVSRILITRADSGHNQFNSSEIAGNLVAAGISISYHPAGDRTLVDTMSVWGTSVGWDTMSNFAEEFWPDIHVWLKQKVKFSKQE
jgi:hypothetical protein